MQTFFENNKKQIKVYVTRSNFDKINNAKPFWHPLNKFEFCPFFAGISLEFSTKTNSELCLFQ